MTRTTGATDDQITAAARLLYNVIMTGDSAVPHITGIRETFDVDMRRHGTMRKINEAASYLVPPDQRIVAVADLRSVMELAMTSAWAADNYEIIDRITALIGDEA